MTHITLFLKRTGKNEDELTETAEKSKGNTSILGKGLRSQCSQLHTTVHK